MEHSDNAAHALKSVQYSQDIMERPLHERVLATELNQIGEPNPEGLIENLEQSGLIGISKYDYVYLQELGREQLNDLN
jgi:hypothetical protein